MSFITRFPVRRFDREFLMKPHLTVKTEDLKPDDLIFRRSYLSLQRNDNGG